MTNLEIRTTLLNTLFNFAATLVSSFVSVYLYVYADSLIIMSIYTIIRIGLFPVSFILGSKISKKVPFTYTYTIGLILITCSLIYILSGTALFIRNRYYVLIAALITGVGEGFYYFSANTCNQVVSSVETRAKFLAYNGIFNNVASLMAPFVSNLIINRASDDMRGYTVILYLTVIIYVCVVAIALTINKKSDDNDISLLSVLSLKDERWKDHQLAVFFYGLNNSMALTLMTILIFNAAKNGDVYSKLQTFFALICILSYRLVAKKMNKESIDKTINFGVILKISSTAMLVLFTNMFGAIYYGITNALATAFFDNTYNYLSATIIGKYPEEMTARVVVREVILSLGRCMGMAFIILCYSILPENLYLKVSVIILSIMPIFVKKTLMKYNR